MATAGYTTIGTLTDLTGTSGTINPVGAMITMPENGNITKLTAHVADTTISTGATCYVYAGSAGARGSSIIGVTIGATVTTSFQWLDFTFASPFPATNTTYWLQFNGDGGNGPGGDVGQIKYDVGGASNTSYNDSDLGVPIYGSNQYSFYATYTATAATTNRLSTLNAG